MSTPKMLVLGLWAVLAAVALLPTGGALVAGARALLALLLVGHVIECLLYLPRLRRQAGGLGAQLLQTLVFGAFHLRELPRG